MRAGLCFSSEERRGPSRMAVSVDIQRKHRFFSSRFYTCEYMTCHSCEPFFIEELFFPPWQIIWMDVLVFLFSFSILPSDKLCMSQRISMKQHWHTVFILQLIWMYYFIHELFPDFIKQWYQSSFNNRYNKTLSNIFKYIYIYLSVCTLNWINYGYPTLCCWYSHTLKLRLFGRIWMNEIGHIY